MVGGEKNMKIETYDKVYTVVQSVSSDVAKDCYVCRNQEDQLLYTVIKIKKKKITSQIIEFICEQKNNKKFSDLVEHFVSEEKLHIVFSHEEGLCLQKYLEQKCTLEERLELGKKILEKLVLYELHPYFQCECLKKENIYITEAMDISFRYTLEKIEKHSSYSEQMAKVYFYQCIKLLFEEELKNNVVKPMQDFLKKVEKMEKLDYLALYKSYCKVCEQVRKIPKEEMRTPKGRLFFLWEKIKSMRKWIKRSIMLIIFLCVLGFTVYSIVMSFRTKGYEKHFETIGTVQIENDGLEVKEE